MRTDWFFPRKLASRLAQGQVPNREVAYIMLANLLFYPIRNLAAIGGSFEWLWTFIAVVAWEIAFFFVLRRSLALARSDA